MAAQTPIRASTQEHLEIADIKDDLVLLKNGNVSLILKTTAVNFGLLSEKEQDAIIFAYAGLLNSLTFPVQIVIRSKRSDVSTYIKLLNNQEERQTNPDLKAQIRKYKEFILATVQQNQVLDKSFYFVIPFSIMEMGTAGAISSLIGKKGKNLPYQKEYILEQAKANLYPKRDHLIKQLTRLGLNARQLTTQELVELFYDIYNPTEVASEKVAADIKDYTAPLVSPLIDTIKQKAPQPETKPIQPIAPNSENQVVMPKRTTSSFTATKEALEKKLTGEETGDSPLATSSQTTQISQNQQKALKALQEAMAKAKEALKENLQDYNIESENNKDKQK